MEYSKIISVTGMPGLYELVSSKNDGALVRSLEDRTTKFVSSRVHNFSHLESIEVYTTDENVNLVDVFKAMQSATQTLPAEKDAAAVKQYFMAVVPTLDFERVYYSDMKKMVRWFQILQKNEIDIKLREEEAADQEEAAAPQEPELVAAPAEEKKPKKKTAKKTNEEG